MRYFLLLALSIACLATTLHAQSITTIAGNGIAIFSGDGAAATSASIYYPYDVCTDASGNVFIADYYNHAIRKINTAGVISTVAGVGGAGGYDGDGGPATAAHLYFPSGLAFDAAGNLYIGDAGNMVIRKVSTTGIITTFAGTHEGGYNGDEIAATTATLYKPSGMVFDKSGSLVFADILNHRIRKITKDGIIHTIVGNGTWGYGGDGGQATAAAINIPHTIIYDAAGNLYIPDYGNNRLRKVSTTGIITTIAGNGTAGFSGDGGPATSAGINPVGVATDTAGNIYVSDPENNRVRKITNGIITTVAGNGSAAFSGDGGAATAAGVNNPWGIRFDKNGALLICDRFNNRIRKVAFGPPPTITSFTPASAGRNQAVVITGTNFTGASIVSFGGVPALLFVVNSATKITAKPNAGATGDVSVTTPNGTATKSGFVYCVTPSIKITSSATAAFCYGTKVKFTATATNGGTAPVYQWYKNDTAVGANSNIYNDSTLHTGDSVYCALTSNASPCVTTATVKSTKLGFAVTPVVVPSVTIAASPGNQICTGGVVKFTATVANGGFFPTYAWRKNGAAYGPNYPEFSDTLKNGDTIILSVTSTATCAIPATVISNQVVISVVKPQPDITIVADKDSAICSGTKVRFTATVKPSYLWKKNGVAVGANSSTYLDSTLKSSDNVQCFLVSSVGACNTLSSNILNSNIIKFKVNAPPAKPASIAGPATVKAHQTGIYFSVTAVAGATYSWTLPAGAVIDSGQGGNKIKVTWGSTAGNVTVIAVNSCGSSAPATRAVAVSAGLKGQVATGSIENNNVAAAADGISVYPNPARTGTTLQFTAKAAGQYVATVVDEQGKVVYIKTGTSVKGNNTLKLNTATYAKGTYFITVTSKQGGQQGKELVVGGE